MKNTLTTKDDTKLSGSTIVPHTQSSLFHNFQQEMNKLFEEFSHGIGLRKTSGEETFSACLAKIDVKDVGSDIVITAEVPGVEMHDLEITATPGYVCIAGEKKAEKEEKEKGYYRMEREYGYFRRVVPVPCEIDKERVDAVFKNGVLTLTLPKTKAALENEKKVTIKAG